MNPLPPFNSILALRYAHEYLASPPRDDYITRVEPVGDLVAEFVLPPELCKTGNLNRHRPGWAIAKDKTDLWSYMLVQWMKSRASSASIPALPLLGRPQVLCTRFTSQPVDTCSDWAKSAVDMLTAVRKRKPGAKVKPTKKRLGIITDDAPKNVSLHQWWESAPRGRGVVLIRVFTGETTQ